jgi:hypothetical protein
VESKRCPLVYHHQQAPKHINLCTRSTCLIQSLPRPRRVNPTHPHREETDDVLNALLNITVEVEIDDNELEEDPEGENDDVA